ncbi:MAG: EamA family transporter [Oscillospiraceae bacterium]|nr:EamA family transporter [Oscillospiraceae bacterium]
MYESKSSRIMLIMSMVIFGTIGIFRKYIPMPSGVLAMARGFIGAIFLLGLVKLGNGKISKRDVGRNLPVLLVSGAALGINWILLFEAYRFTSVATATLAYYMAPVMVILLSPLLFRERITAKKFICVLFAVAGMALVSGIFTAEGEIQLKGIAFGLAAAVFYALVMILGKSIRDISAYDKTIVQLFVAAVVLLPYVVATGEFRQVAFTPVSAAMLAVVGIVHTGIAYALYFGSMRELKSQTIALFSYIDPALAVVLSAVVLREQMGLAEILGAVMVLGATMISELPERKRNRYF